MAIRRPYRGRAAVMEFPNRLEVLMTWTQVCLKPRCLLSHSQQKVGRN